MLTLPEAKYAPILSLVRNSIRKSGVAKVYKLGMDEKLNEALRDLADENQWCVSYPATNMILLVDYLSFNAIQA